MLTNEFVGALNFNAGAHVFGDNVISIVVSKTGDLDNSARFSVCVSAAEVHRLQP